MGPNGTVCDRRFFCPMVIRVKVQSGRLFCRQKCARPLRSLVIANNFANSPVRGNCASGISVCAFSESISPRTLLRPAWQARQKSAEEGFKFAGDLLKFQKVDALPSRPVLFLSCPAHFQVLASSPCRRALAILVPSPVFCSLHFASTTCCCASA